MSSHNRAYMHHALRFGGRHASGPSSPLERFSLASIATSCCASVRSFAYARRCADVHAHAPERHAFASGTVWSMSKSCATVVTSPDHGSIQRPVATVQSDELVYVTGTRDVAISTSAR